MEFIDGKLKYTLEEELMIYKEARKIHKEDIKLCKRNDYPLNGMCENIALAIFNLAPHIKSFNSIDSFPRFLKLKPKTKKHWPYWWGRKATSLTRDKKYAFLIEDTEKEIEQNKRLK